MSHIVETRDLTIRLGGKTILNKVNISIRCNTISVIMGPSGSGKSTLLRVFNRLIELNPEAEVSGEITIMGKDIYEWNPYELRRHVVLVQQEPTPFPNLSIFENIALPARLNKVARSREELEKLVRWSLEKVMLWDEVKDRLWKPPTSLSGGQKQRLCIARALALRPHILLLDEPTANIDPVNTLKIEESLKELKNDITMILVTHMPHQAARIGDYVYVLYNGGIVEEGPVNDVFIHPRHEVTIKLLERVF
ncbi:phosphate ABC transporter ATP-binding protein [Desulfurococcus amylolyticus]|uniref:phosphate ABC transporter ATP-binding protein n=1 Tax=Desulfurococcus amylolyticus TaxID=94694 RepID=UPI0005B1D46D|nr:phosphate ABC transporter ATP-binding protein [Desulfurococcus amylolyticus]